jgi:hypothetical protein
MVGSTFSTIYTVLVPTCTFVVLGAAVLTSFLLLK